METKHINDIFEEKVHQIFQSATTEANEIFASTFESKIQDKNLYQKLKLLSEEHYRLYKIEKESEYPFYIYYHGNNQYLLNQFASRAFLLKVDESEILHECIKVGRLKMLTHTKFDIVLRELPEYTYVDFIGGKSNPILFDLEIYNQLNDIEFQRIRLWQEGTLINIVEYELKCLIPKFQQHLDSVENPITVLNKNLERFNSMPDSKISAIHTWLKGFSFFEGINFEKFDNNILIEGFYAFKNDVFIYKYLIPENLNPVVKKQTKKNITFIPNGYSIFYTLYKVRQWLTLAIANNSWNIPFVEIDWKKKFEEKQLESRYAIENFKGEIERFINDTEKSFEQVKEYLSQKYHEYRRRFDRFEPKKYFEFYARQKGDYSFRKFTAYAYFEPDPQKELGLISEAIVIQALAQFIHKKYVDVVKERIVDYVDLNIFMNEIPNILSHMIYDRDLYMGLLTFHNNFNRDHWSYGLPVDMMELNYKDFLEDYFQKVIDRLEDTLKTAEQNKSILFLQTRLKQMKLRSLDFMKYRFSEQRHKVKSKYSDMFKEYLEIEADFIYSTKDISTQIAVATENRSESFDSIFPGQKGAFILDMLEDLSITVEGSSKLSKRRMGAIRGVVDALLSNKIAPKLSIDVLCRHIAKKINLPLNSKLNFTDISEEFEALANDYIKRNYPR